MENEAKGTNVIGVHSIEELAKVLKRPRKIILLVKAGPAVDDFIAALLPHLEQGDIIIDGGNSHYPDTNRRCKELEGKGFLYVGSGVSGGEEGARYGPSLSGFHRLKVKLCPKLSLFQKCPVAARKLGRKSRRFSKRRLPPLMEKCVIETSQRCDVDSCLTAMLRLGVRYLTGCEMI
jgi:hypothetical protein